MLEFKLNEQNYFEFEMQITGDVETNVPPVVEFTVNLNNGMKMSFLAERKDSVYAVTLPVLKEYQVKSGEHDCSLNVFLGDKYYAPYSGKCVFKEEAKPVVSNMKMEHKEEKKAAPMVTFIQQKSAPTPAPVLQETKEEPVAVTAPVIQEPPKKEVNKEELGMVNKLLGRNKEK
jgi:hypothetical protein